MLEGKELEMYHAENKNVKVTLTDGEILEGYCREFSFEHEIEKIEYKN